MAKMRAVYRPVGSRRNRTEIPIHVEIESNSGSVNDRRLLTLDEASELARTLTAAIFLAEMGLGKVGQTTVHEGVR